jgi:hypothetical protein
MAFKIDVADDMAPVGHSVWPHWSPRLALVEHSVWPRLAPSIWLCLAPRLAPIRTLEKNLIFFVFVLVVVAGWKRREKIFRFSIPKIPELRGLRRRSCEKKKLFSA